MKDTHAKSLTEPDEIVRLAGLYDTYGALLKGNQRGIFEAYVLENLSLSEIAEEYEMTRQGVYDTINRSRKKLYEFEEKLGLRERDHKIFQVIRSADIDDREKDRLIEAIEGI